MNFFRTLKQSPEPWNALKREMLERRYAQADRADIPPEPELVNFIHSLSDEDFHRLLVICGAFMAKSRGLDIFNLPHPPG